MAAWLLNLAVEAELGKATTGPGSTTGGKLAEAVRLAFLGGYYDAGALQLEVILDPIYGGPRYLNAEGRILELAETDLALFGHHPVQIGELDGPTFAVTLENADGKYSPGNPAGYIPSANLGGSKLIVEVWEHISAVPTKIFSQDFALAEARISHIGESVVATLLGVHPLAGWLGNRWAYEDGDLLDWGPWPHGMT